MPRHHAVAAHLFQSNSMRIASWNVNSAKARLDIIINWLKSDSCDVLLLQETKSQDERVQKRTSRAVCVASADDQADLMNQTPQHNGMWLRRDALEAIDLSRKSMQPRRKEMPCRLY